MTHVHTRQSVQNVSVPLSGFSHNEHLPRFNQTFLCKEMYFQYFPPWSTGGNLAHLVTSADVLAHVWLSDLADGDWTCYWQLVYRGAGMLRNILQWTGEPALSPQQQRIIWSKCEHYSYRETSYTVITFMGRNLR